MRILAAGGGSGGHVTPVVAVLRELRSRDASVEVKFWCDRKFAPQARAIMRQFDPDLPVETIWSGKLRRYHGVSFWGQLAAPSIVLRNLGDAFLAAAGLVQSVFKLLVWRPDAVFTKGGFVCLPIGLAARLLGIPLVIHDSDAHPGLTNRILARYATGIATGAPLEFYPYPKAKSRYVGIPIGSGFKPFDKKRQRQAKQAIGADPARPLVVVTGGGLGAKRINDAVAACLDALLEHTSVILIAGSSHYDELRAKLPPNSDRFQLHGFVADNMVEMLGAADVVVARAGATTILELAALQKPTILIPNARLTGGHQLKNAAVYAEKGAVMVLNEDELAADSQRLASAIVGLLNDPPRRAAMAAAFGEFARPQAARETADMIIAAARKR